MSVDVLPAVQRGSARVVSTFNSYHDTGLPSREWLIAGSGTPPNGTDNAKTQPASSGVGMQAWSNRAPASPLGSTPSAQRAIPSAQSRTASGGAPASNNYAESGGSDEAFVDTGSSPTCGSVCSDFFQDAKECAFFEGTKTLEYYTFGV